MYVPLPVMYQIISQMSSHDDRTAWNNWLGTIPKYSSSQVITSQHGIVANTVSSGSAAAAVVHNSLWSDGNASQMQACSASVVASRVGPTEGGRSSRGSPSGGHRHSGEPGGGDGSPEGNKRSKEGGSFMVSGGTAVNACSILH